MIVRANCKLNLGLDVLRRREDGFHELETVMYPVNELCDIVDVAPCEGKEPQFVNVGIAVDCPIDKNICIKAWQLMHERYGVGAVRITLDKRIPFGAGLGGGSADGTAVILALNAIFGLGLEESELIGLAAELGSDTAFFVRNTPQLCTGRGEIMEPVDVSLRGLWLLLVKPNEGVSTREAYSGIKPYMPATTLRERIARPVAEWQSVLKNDFEPHVFAAHPTIREIKEWLLSQGAIYASMSGSGSAVFGLFEHKIENTPPFDGVFVHCEKLEI